MWLDVGAYKSTRFSKMFRVNTGQEMTVVRCLKCG